MTTEDGTTLRAPARTPIFDELIAQAGIDWPDDTMVVGTREPETSTPHGS